MNNTLKRTLSKNQKTLVVLFLLIASILLTTCVHSSFISVANLGNMARWSALYGILSLGVCFVIITGGIDLSIGSVVGLSGALFPLLLMHHGLSIPSCFIITIGISLIIGLVHGLLITKLKLQAFIVTLCGLFVYRGITRSFTNDTSQGFGVAHDEGLRQLVTFKIFDLIPMPVALIAVLGIIAAILLNKTIYGRYLLALGKNEEATRYSGVNTDRTTIGAYVICSGLAGFGGILFALGLNSIQPSIFGNFYELYAIAGAVLGGCSLRGGEGTIMGVILGAALVQVIANAARFAVSDKLEFTVIGLVILSGVILDQIVKQVMAKKMGEI